jgi:glyoxylate reductase
MFETILIPWLLPDAGREVLKNAGIQCRFLHGPNGELPTPEELVAAVKDVGVLLPRATLNVPDEVIKANLHLKGVANWGVGYNNINIPLATELGIPVTNTPGILTETTADLAWALLMATARKIPQAHQYVLSGDWKGPGGKAFMGADIGPGGSNRSKVLGIVGFGKIGQAVYRRSQGFRMKVLVYDPPLRELIEQTEGVEYRELADLLKESDFITLHSPLTPATRHLIGKKELDAMKPSAVLVNTSRGPIVDEASLVEALRQGKIAGAGLDVYENAPVLAPGLKELDNVVLLPHIASASEDTRSQMAVLAAENAIIMLKGKKSPNTVNPQVFDGPEYCRRIER